MQQEYSRARGERSFPLGRGSWSGRGVNRLGAAVSLIWWETCKNSTPLD